MRPFHGVRGGSRLARRASRARADQSGWATLFHPFAPAQSARAAKESARRLHYAERHSVDLITMPTHGYGPFRAALLGSVTAKVIHDTRSPVWTSVHAEKIHNPPYPYRLIVCAVADLEASIPVIQRAGEIAGAFESSLVLVHAVPSSERRTESEIRSGL